MVELVVMREVACNTPISPALYLYLSFIIATACDDRRNVRVSHILQRLDLLY